jgi:transposase-like protein
MKIITTCPFCFAKLIGTDVPKKCPHCNTKFKDDDNLQIKKKVDWMDKALKPEVRL